MIAVDHEPDTVTEPDGRWHLFLAAHWSASTRPVPALVHCGGDVAVVPIAPLGALVACKLHAWITREPAKQPKRASDGLDIVQLLDHADREALIVELSDQPELRRALSWAAQHVLTDQAHRVSHLIKVWTAAAPPGDDHVRLLGELVRALCSEAG